MEKECRDIVENFINKYNGIFNNLDLYDLKTLFKNKIGKNNDLRVKKNQEMWCVVKKYYISQRKGINNAKS